MKNILKKLGVFGLIVAVLVPFIELPVKADTTTETCDTYLQNYLFMDLKYSWTPWTAYTSGDGYRTFTSFIYDFPTLAANEKLTIESVSSAYLYSNDDLKNFYDAYSELVDDTTVKISDMNKLGHYRNVAISGADYKQVTYLLHGKWARDGENWTIDADYGKDSSALFSGDYTNLFSTYTLQGVLNKITDSNIKEQIVNDLNMQVSGASFTDNGSAGGAHFTVAGQYILGDEQSNNSKLIQYFQQIVDDVNSGNLEATSWKNRYIWNASNNKTYLNLSIARKISEESLNKLTFGYPIKDSNSVATGNYQIISTDPNSIVNSYDAYLKYYDNGFSCSKNGTDICYAIERDTAPNFEIGQGSPQYYIPFVLGVKYKVCRTENVSEWKLIYNANVPEEDLSVKNIPATQTTKVGEKLTISNGPSREGWKFEKWCVEKEPTSSENCFAPGIELESQKDVELFAQWSKTGSEDNKDTGISTYVIAFAAVGIIAGVLYLVTKKQNRFNQI